jgi:F-type H+-transporting ATPase subunit delta
VLKGATSRRYAEAAFGLAVEEKTVDEWLKDLRLIAEYFSDHRLVFLLGEPNIQFTRKELVVKDLLSGKVQPQALNLALLLVERRLVELAPRVRDEFERKYNEYHNQTPARLTTAMPIDDETRSRVQAELQRLTGKRILLDEQVDPSILGGAIARVGDTLIDGSVRRRLQLLRQQMARGGTFSSQMEGVSDVANAAITANGASASGGDAPFVVGPAEPDTSPNGGSATATDMAPRRGQSPHMAPRQPNQPGPSGQSGTGNSTSSSNPNASKNNHNSRKRGRRR